MQDNKRSIDLLRKEFQGAVGTIGAIEQVVFKKDSGDGAPNIFDTIQNKIADLVISPLFNLLGQSLDPRRRRASQAFRLNKHEVNPPL